MFKKLRKKVYEEIWGNDEKKSLKGFFYKILRVVFTSVNGFLDDKILDKAPTLTFYTLLSIVPLVAIGFGIAQEFGFEDKFREQVNAQLSTQPEVAEKIIEFSTSTLKQTKSGVIAGFGILILLWTVLRMIVNIEVFFNAIWKVKTPRSFMHQLRVYFPAILIFPLFLVGSNSLVLYLSTIALFTTHSVKYLSLLSPYVIDLLKTVPYMLSWGVLSAIYIYLPNTKVSWKAGILAGITTGLLYQIWQWIYVTFQVNASSYGTIYGSFAAIPLFLIWLNYSWIIILFGTELSYHIQEELKEKKKRKS